MRRSGVLAGLLVAGSLVVPAASAASAPPPAVAPTVKPGRVATVTIDPASISAASPDVTAAVDPGGVGGALTVELTTTGAMTVDGGRRQVASDGDSEVTAPATAPRGPATVRATLRRDGQPIGSDTVWVDRAGSEVVVSDIGTQDLALRVADAKLAAGLLTPAQAAAAREEALFGGALTTAWATPQAGCAAVCLTGTVRWTDSTGATHPVPFAPVTVFEDETGADQTIATLTTDANGNYAANFDNNDGAGEGGRDLYIRVRASGTGFNLNQTIQSGTTSNIATGSDVTINLTANNTADNNTAFSLQNALTVAVRWVTAVRGSSFPTLTVNFPANGSFYNGSSINLLQLDRWDWDVILHEYGHFVSDQLGIDDNPGGSHSSSDNLSTTTGSKDVGTRLAWGEGWPTYWGTSAMQDMGTAALGIPFVGDAAYTDTEDANFTLNLESGGTLGEDNEFTVMSTLWDLYDGPQDGIDRSQLGSVAIWNALDAANPTRLSSAYTPFSGNAAADCAFSQLNVAPRLSGAAENAFVSNTSSPALSWTAGNGGPFPNNSFVVEYRRVDGSLLFASSPQAGTTFTAPSGTWNTIRDSAGGVVVISVVGSQTNAPATGPYRSCARRFTDAGVAPSFVPVVPERLLDTRGPTQGGQIGFTGATPGNGATVALDVTGVGAANVPDGAAAVVLNVTGVGPTAEGFVTVWPCGQPRPNASSLNLVPGTTRPNLVVVQPGTNGQVCLFTQNRLDLVADLAGWYRDGNDLVGVTPSRLLDTRPLNQGGQIGYSGGQPAAGSTTQLDVVGVSPSNVPADARAVVLNVIGVSPAADGFVTVWPCGQARPNASNINLQAGVTTANLVVVQPGTGGNVCLFASQGVHLVADIDGWHRATGSLVGVTPKRLLDTRGAPFGPIGYAGAKPAAGATVIVQATGGTTTVPTGARAVVLNVTGVDGTSPGFVTAYPCDKPRPLASNLNLVTGQVAPNLVYVPTSATGTVCLFTSGGAHLLADVAAYYP